MNTLKQFDDRDIILKMEKISQTLQVETGMVELCSVNVKRLSDTFVFWHTVAHWHCGTAAMWHCGSVAMWFCGTVAVWYCSTIQLWHCGSVARAHWENCNSWHLSPTSIWPPSPAPNQLSFGGERVISDGLSRMVKPSQAKVNIFIISVFIFAFILGLPLVGRCFQLCQQLCTLRWSVGGSLTALGTGQSFNLAQL